MHSSHYIDTENVGAIGIVTVRTRENLFAASVETNFAVFACRNDHAYKTTLPYSGYGYFVIGGERLRINKEYGLML